MARKPRFNMDGIPQHIIQRGNNRQATFFAEEDYRRYLDCLTEAARKYDGLNDSDPIFAIFAIPFLLVLHKSLGVSVYRGI